MQELPPPAFYARTYDASVSDWPAELPFYLELARATEGGVLELACGTGRICIRLARAGVAIVGLDKSADMIAVARANGAKTDLLLVEGDMRNFDLGRQFGLVIIPGHSFQNLLTASDQQACLAAIRRHLRRDGWLAIHLDHQDIDWLGAISVGGALAGVFEPAETFDHPDTGRRVQASRAWVYRRSDQAAIVTTRWDEKDANDRLVATYQTQPTPIHCVFRFEMEHLLALAGFSVEAQYGNFEREPLTEESSEMIWIGRPTAD